MTTPTPPATPPTAPPPPAPKAPEKSRYSDPDTVLEFTSRSLKEGILRTLVPYQIAVTDKAGKKSRTRPMPAAVLNALANACNRYAEITGAKAPVRNEHTGKDGERLIPDVSADDLVSRLARIAATHDRGGVSSKS